MRDALLRLHAPRAATSTTGGRPRPTRPLAWALVALAALAGCGSTADDAPNLCTDGTTTTSAGRPKGEQCSDLCGRDTQAAETVTCTTALPANTRLPGTTHYVQIQPWQVANDDGSSPAYPSCDLHEDIVDKVFAQAGVDVEFLPWRAWNSTAAGVNAAQNGCLNWVADDGRQHDDTAGVLNLYLIHELNPGRVGGIGEEPGNAFFVCEACFAASLHVLAHEMGHNLGLGHDNLGAGADDHNLMSADLPSNDLGDVFPDGAGYLHLTAEQIDRLRNHPAVKPL